MNIELRKKKGYTTSDERTGNTMAGWRDDSQILKSLKYDIRI